MQCYVYKGDNKEEHYLYLANEFASQQSSQQEVPKALVDMLGELTLIVEFELTSDRKLPNADPQQIIADIERQGFFLQMPKEDMYADEERIVN